MSWLKVKKGDQNYNLRVVDQGNSALKVRRNGVTYDVCLVDPNDSTASPVRVKTNNEGVKAIQLAPGYTITASVSGGNGSIDPFGAVTVLAEGSQTFNLIPITGYHLSDLVRSDTGSVFSSVVNNQYTARNVNNNFSLTASFSNQYKITASAGPNGSIDPSGQVNVNQGSTPTFTITPNSRYLINGVYVNGSPVDPVASYTFPSVQTDNQTISATFALSPTCVIAASTGEGGTISPSGTTVVMRGDNLTYTFTPNSGYMIDTVFVDSIRQGPISTYTFSNVQDDHMIRSQFQTAIYTINSSAGTGGTISPSGQTNVTHGSSQAYTITPVLGYSIYSVIVDGTSVGAVSTYQFANIQADHTIEATFRPLYAITSAAGTGGTISPLGTTLVIQGGSQSYTITPNEGYSIYTVYVNGQWQGAISTYTFTNVQASQPIEAFFQQITYGIVSSAGPGGSISPSGGTTVNWGGSQSYSITPNYGYLIADVSVDGYSQGAISYYTFTNVQANHTISATFEYCQSCYECQTPCDVCQACYTCQASCELSCQTGCEVACQTTCELACQTGCQVSCQTGCEVSCETGCQVSCETGCEVSCQTGCEVSCQTGCQVSCQDTCQLSCQTGCEVSCETTSETCPAGYYECQGCDTCQGCQISCQDTCQLACQTCYTSCQSCNDCQTCVSCETSEVCPAGYYECQSCESCQAGCEVSCQTACETSCQSCYASCQSCNNCQVCVSCEMSEWCPSGYYECQSCESCQPGYT